MNDSNYEVAAKWDRLCNRLGRAMDARDSFRQSERSAYGISLMQLDRQPERHRLGDAVWAVQAVQAEMDVFKVEHYGVA